jgi:2-succinyl-5-enolpyruvyl-6-hydroxy-3-cyclohexene-1-carboxylate synthase
MKNIDLVKTVISVIQQIGVKDVIVCAGARNVPLIHGLEHEGLNIQSYFEERSSAFYALGKSKSLQAPVAIVTTSGTAVAELLPAAIEAFYQNIPLVFITADRPKSYRGTGSPQAISQKNILKEYTESSLDWDIHQKDFNLTFSGDKPLHLNICFDEPLNDGDYENAVAANVKINKKMDLEVIGDALGVVPKIKCKNPLVIVSALESQDQIKVISFLKKNKLFHVAEFLSGLRNHGDLKEQQIHSLDGFSDLKEQYGFESVIRIGGIPTHRVWRDLEGKYNDLPVVSFSHLEFTGLSRESKVHTLSHLQHIEINWSNTFNPEKMAVRSNSLELAKKNSLNKYPESELSFIRQLSRIVKDQPLYIGNSLPIREWDLVSDFNQNAQQNVFANRGANGIDGQISSYLGWAEHFSEAWCLVGDLTALYDLASLGFHQSSFRRRIVVMNNSGGRIFNRIFGHEKYLNAQAVNFAGWAQLWNWSYVRIDKLQDLEQLEKLPSQKVLIEVVCDNTASEAFWKEWDSVCKA